MNLPQSLKEDLTDRKQRNELSIYELGKVTPETLTLCISEIKKAFPKLSLGWYDVLEKILDEEGFSDQKLIDATKMLIKSCQYPEPTIANIIGYDRTVKVYLYDELLTICKDYSPNERGVFLKCFSPINFYGEMRWAKKEDIIRFNLTKWKKNNGTDNN